jgi:alkylation response protein AidB-like acyl-CoA dehydrogenase
MKHLGKFEPLRAQFTRQSGRYCLNGTFPWVTNLVPIGFVSALAAGNPENDTAAIFAVPHDAHGVMRSDDLDLIGLRGSHTASLALHNTVLEEDWIIHPQATVFLPHIRPALIGMQCGWALGIAKASLKAACGATEMTRSILNHEAQALNDDLHHYWQQLARGIDKGDFREQPRQLFEIRIVLIELAMRAVQLELQALGGRAYQSSDSAAFQRRWREAAFLPIVTPSLVQIKAQLASRA